jgi:hypothetical protein
MDQVAVWAESLPQVGDLRFQIILRDKHTWPNASYELFLADQRSIRLKQNQQELEPARSQLYRRAVCNQQPLTQQHPKPAEFEQRFSC